MKEKIHALIYSFFALFLFSCAVASAILFSMLLIPLLILTIFIIAVREMLVWRRKRKQMKKNSTVRVTYHETAVVRSIPENRPYRRVA